MFFLLLVAIASAQSTFSPTRPPSIPLAVKSPYLSAWQAAGNEVGNGGYLAGEWPTFWNNEVVGWTGLIRVDGETYLWMGDPIGTPKVDQTSFEYTATRSIFTQEVNNAVQLTVTFLSPLTPDDFTRASLVSSYMNVDVASLDGKSHKVELYTDITAEWVSGDRSTTAQWDYNTTSGSPTGTSASGDLAYHRVYRQTQLAFSEVNDQTEYGYWYFMTANTPDLTYQSGFADDLRGQFASSGTLNDTTDTDFRAISDRWPTFGFALDLGSVGSIPTSSLFTINLNQQQAIQFEGYNGVQPVPSLWTSYFGSDDEANAYFYNDYEQAKTLADNFDSKVDSDSTAAAGANYSVITTLSARQAFGAIQLTGTPNETYVFLKEISSDGNVNTVDVIFPWMPIMLYTNPSLLKMALEPLFINQQAGDWPQKYAIHDIGSHYPNATGHNDGNAEAQPLEECGNMIIMSLAYAQRANDTAWLSSHYNLLNQWVSYLIQEALIPQYQISTDDFAGALANQTNLALKGIIGIRAMAEISSLTSHPSDAENYTAIASSYISQWIGLGTTNSSLPHTTLSYGNDSSFSLLYNLYAAPLLGLGSFVPQTVYEEQSAFYPSVALRYGVPLDTRHTWTKLDWQLFCAAIAGQSTRDLFIGDIATWIGQTRAGYPMTDLYIADSGDVTFQPPFRARPVVGGSFSLLALQEGSVPS